MSEVVEFRPRQSHDLHLSGRARCLACAHEWEAAAPAGVIVLECPQCACLQGRWRNYLEPEAGVHTWRCRCENDLFFVTPESVVCARCGSEQRFPSNPPRGAA